jgi:glucose/arabinose dehydrogenase
MITVPSSVKLCYIASNTACEESLGTDPFSLSVKQTTTTSSFSFLSPWREARVLTTCSETTQPNAALADGLCSQVLPVTVQEPRTIVAVNNGGLLLVLERATESSVVLLADSNNNDSIPDAYRKIATLSGLNHGLAVDFDRELLYASTAGTVDRWTVNMGGGQQQQPPWTNVSAPVAVVTNLSDNGKGSASARGHFTRSLVLDATGGFLFVSVGAAGNVDQDSFRSRVRKVDVRDSTAFPIDFTTAPVHADGLRNEVGLAWDASGTLWGIHQDNPAEELNRLDGSNRHYGYPYCWTEYSLPAGLGRGTAWAWPSSDLGSVTYTDAECRNTSRFQPPGVSMQGHSAPLGITFYKHVPESQRPAGCAGGGAFPSWMDGYAFIAFHGSWNRDIPTGYKVVDVEMKDGRATSEPIDLLKHGGSGAAWPDGFRPVSVDFDACGRLYVSSDGSGSGSTVVRIEYLVASSPSSAPANAKCQSTRQACGSGAPCCGSLKCVKATNGARRVCRMCRALGKKCQPGLHRDGAVEDLCEACAKWDPTMQAESK